METIPINSMESASDPRTSMLRSGPAAMMMSFFSNPKKDLEQVHFFWQIFIHIYIYRYMYIHVIYVYIYIRIHMYIYTYVKNIVLLAVSLYLSIFKSMYRHLKNKYGFVWVIWI